MKLLVSAMEPSSNLHLKELLKHLKNVEIVGIFDKNLGKPIYDNNSSAMMGFVDIFKKIKFFLNLKKEMVKLAKDVDKVLLMDSSGFNLPLAKDLKKVYPNKEIIYYILPQVWAWRSYRAKIIEKYCDKLCAILPFEVEFYKNKAKYVGHPLLDEITDIKSSLTNNNIIAFMPGSRKKEIKNLMPIFKEVRKKLSDKEAILIVPPFLKGSDIYGDISDFKLCYDTQKGLKMAHYAFICSGTATFEASIIGTPFSLVYIMGKFDWFLAKNLTHIKYAGLANILLDRYDKTFLH